MCRALLPYFPSPSQSLGPDMDQHGRQGQVSLNEDGWGEKHASPSQWDLCRLASPGQTQWTPSQCLLSSFPLASKPACADWRTVVNFQW